MKYNPYIISQLKDMETTFLKNEAKYRNVYSSIREFFLLVIILCPFTILLSPAWVYLKDIGFDYLIALIVGYFGPTADKLLNGNYLIYIISLILIVGVYGIFSCIMPAFILLLLISYPIGFIFKNKTPSIEYDRQLPQMLSATRNIMINDYGQGPILFYIKLIIVLILCYLDWHFVARHLLGFSQPLSFNKFYFHGHSLVFKTAFVVLEVFPSSLFKIVILRDCITCVFNFLAGTKADPLRAKNEM